MKKLGFILACGIVSSFGPAVNSVQASEVPVVLTGCPCNQKRLPADKEQELYKQMAEQAKKNKQVAGGVKKWDQRSCYCFRKGPQFPTVKHTLVEKDAKGSLVTIQDGSVWEVNENGQAEVQTWAPNSAITIKPNKLSLWNKIRGTTPTHKYLLVYGNRKVEANLKLGPFKANKNTRIISRIDADKGEVYLTNGTMWKVDMSSPCKEIFKDWQKDHGVILGTNDTWFSLGSPSIMINIDTDNWLPATRAF